MQQVSKHNLTAQKSPISVIVTSKHATKLLKHYYKFWDEVVISCLHIIFILQITLGIFYHNKFGTIHIYW